MTPVPINGHTAADHANISGSLEALRTHNAEIILQDSEDGSSPFEGPEKLLEIWWSDSAEHAHGKGLRNVTRRDWEEMLDQVHCKVLSVIEGDGVDAYLLRLAWCLSIEATAQTTLHSESSMFVWPHKLILKTCGTTTLLLGLETILQLAKKVGYARGPWRVFYSRKTFMFPDKQKGPHKDWRAEMSTLR